MMMPGNAHPEDEHPAKQFRLEESLSGGRRNLRPLLRGFLEEEPHRRKVKVLTECQRNERIINIGRS